MKKFVAMIMALSLTAVLGACGGADTTEPAPTEEAPDATESPES